MIISSPHHGFSFGVMSDLLLLLATVSIIGRWKFEIKIITLIILQHPVRTA